MHIQYVKMISALRVAVGTSDIGRQGPYSGWGGGVALSGGLRDVRVEKRIRGRAGVSSSSGCWSAAAA